MPTVYRAPAQRSKEGKFAKIARSHRRCFPSPFAEIGAITSATLALALDEGVPEVAVLADSNGEARQLIIKPGKPIAPPVTGAVISKESDEDGTTTLTITRKDGTTMMIRLGSGVSLPWASW